LRPELDLVLPLHQHRAQTIPFLSSRLLRRTVAQRHDFYAIRFQMKARFNVLARGLGPLASGGIKPGARFGQLNL
jgi:hypothetical protein